MAPCGCDLNITKTSRHLECNILVLVVLTPIAISFLNTKLQVTLNVALRGLKSNDAKLTFPPNHNRQQIINQYYTVSITMQMG